MGWDISFLKQSRGELFLFFTFSCTRLTTLGWGGTGQFTSRELIHPRINIFSCLWSSTGSASLMMLFYSTQSWLHPQSYRSKVHPESHNHSFVSVLWSKIESITLETWGAPSKLNYAAKRCNFNIALFSTFKSFWIKPWTFSNFVPLRKYITNLNSYTSEIILPASFLSMLWALEMF